MANIQLVLYERTGNSLFFHGLVVAANSGTATWQL